MMTFLHRLFARQSPAELAAMAWRGRVLGHDAIMVPGKVTPAVLAEVRKRFAV